MTSNTITVRLRRPKSEIRAKAKPNVNAWVNSLIDQALGESRVEWGEVLDRTESSRAILTIDKTKRRER